MKSYNEERNSPPKAVEPKTEPGAKAEPEAAKKGFFGGLIGRKK